MWSYEDLFFIPSLSPSHFTSSQPAENEFPKRNRAKNLRTDMTKKTELKIEWANEEGRQREKVYLFDGRVFGNSGSQRSDFNWAMFEFSSLAQEIERKKEFKNIFHFSHPMADARITLECFELARGRLVKFRSRVILVFWSRFLFVRISNSPINTARPNRSASSIPCFEKWWHVCAYTSLTRLFASTKK